MFYMWKVLPKQRDVLVLEGCRTQHAHNFASGSALVMLMNSRDFNPFAIPFHYEIARVESISPSVTGNWVRFAAASSQLAHVRRWNYA